jgi:hypothetical protein
MMRAKFQVNGVEVTKSGDVTVSELVTMSAVCGSKPFGTNGESEDNTFARWTPFGEVKLQINNPELFGKHKQGQKFYADFTEVVEQAAPVAEAPVAETAPEAAPAATAPEAAAPAAEGTTQG